MKQTRGNNNVRAVGPRSVRGSRPGSSEPKGSGKAGKKIAVAKKGDAKDSSQKQRHGSSSLSPVSIGSEFSVPEEFRRFSEKSILGLKEGYESARNSVEEATYALERSYEIANRGAQDLNVKMIDMAHDGMNKGFELAKDMARAKNYTEVAELQATYYSSLTAAMTNQISEFQALSANVLEEAFRPVKTKVIDSFGDYTTFK